MEPDSEWHIIIAAVVMIITKPARTSSPEGADKEQTRKGTRQNYEGPQGVYRAGSRPATERTEDELFCPSRSPETLEHENHLT